MKTIAKKFVDPFEISLAIKEMKAMAGKTRTVVAGGVAMQFYGSDRLTRDVDFIAPFNSKIPPQIEKPMPLTFGGVTGFTPKGIPVDFITRTDDFQALYTHAVNEANKADDGYYVVTPEHLAIMKMVAGRSKDILDFNFLVTAGYFDLTKARTFAKSFLGAYGLKDFDSMVDEAKWRHEKENATRKP